MSSQFTKKYRYLIFHILPTVVVQFNEVNNGQGNFINRILMGIELGSIHSYKYKDEAARNVALVIDKVKPS